MQLLTLLLKLPEVFFPALVRILQSLIIKAKPKIIEHLSPLNPLYTRDIPLLPKAEVSPLLPLPIIIRQIAVVADPFEFVAGG